MIDRNRKEETSNARNEPLLPGGASVGGQVEGIMALVLFLFSGESRMKRKKKEKSRKGKRQQESQTQETHKEENVIRPLRLLHLIQLTMPQLNTWLSRPQE